MPSELDEKSQSPVIVSKKEALIAKLKLINICAGQVDVESSARQIDELVCLLKDVSCVLSASDVGTMVDKFNLIITFNYSEAERLTADVMELLSAEDCFKWFEQTYSPLFQAIACGRVGIVKAIFNKTGGIPEAYRGTIISSLLASNKNIGTDAWLQMFALLEIYGAHEPPELEARFKNDKVENEIGYSDTSFKAVSKSVAELKKYQPLPPEAMDNLEAYFFWMSNRLGLGQSTRAMHSLVELFDSDRCSHVLCKIPDKYFTFSIEYIELGIALLEKMSWAPAAAYPKLLSLLLMCPKPSILPNIPSRMEDIKTFIPPKMAFYFRGNIGDAIFFILAILSFSIIQVTTNDLFSYINEGAPHRLRQAFISSGVTFPTQDGFELSTYISKEHRLALQIESKAIYKEMSSKEHLLMRSLAFLLANLPPYEGNPQSFPNELMQIVIQYVGPSAVLNMSTGTLKKFPKFLETDSTKTRSPRPYRSALVKMCMASEDSYRRSLLPPADSKETANEMDEKLPAPIA